MKISWKHWRVQVSQRRQSGIRYNNSWPCHISDASALDWLRQCRSLMAVGIPPLWLEGSGTSFRGFRKSWATACYGPKQEAAQFSEFGRKCDLSAYERSNFLINICPKAKRLDLNKSIKLLCSKTKLHIKEKHMLPRYSMYLFRRSGEAENWVQKLKNERWYFSRDMIEPAIVVNFHGNAARR